MVGQPARGTLGPSGARVYHRKSNAQFLEGVDAKRIIFTVTLEQSVLVKEYMPLFIKIKAHNFWNSGMWGAIYLQKATEKNN